LSASPDTPTAANRNIPVWLVWVDAFRSVVSGPAILYLTFTAACVGLLHARALLSIFSGILFGVALLNLLLHRNTFAEIKQYKALIALAAVFSVYIISGLHSDDLQRWWRLTWDNVLFAIIPLGFYIYRNLPTRTWRRLLMIYIGIATLSAVSVCVDYLMHFDAYNELYRIGKTIPTPVIHVRYSYFMALGACLALALAYDDIRYSGPKLRKRVMLGSGIFLAVFVHVLAVRTGLLSLNGGLGIMWIGMVFREGKWRLGIISALAGFGLVLLAYNAFPSVANKLGYVIYDLKMLQEKGAQSEYSDNVRITSIKHGIALLKKQPITGTGIGDIDAEMHRMYASRTPDFPVESRYPPISQYIFTLTAFGVLGAGLFFCFLLYPLFKSPYNYALLAIYTTTLFASIGETTIELQLGKTAFVMMVCVGVLLAGKKRTLPTGPCAQLKSGEVEK
jgi:O-antigen ligase